MKLAPVCLAVLIALTPAPAFAWGATGHEFVTGAAIDMLSKDIPAFLRTRTARAQIALLGREPDRSKGAGKAADAEQNQEHFIDMGDDSLAGHLFALNALPSTRSEYEQALLAKGVLPTEIGVLPYAMIEGWQQISKDFAYWRASKVASRSAKTAADRTWFKADLKLREMILIRDIGVWSHYVGDASQPLHVSEHYNGWDKYPDPIAYPPPGQPPEIRGFHAFFEGPFVKANVRLADIKARMTPYRSCSCPIWERAPAFIATTLTQVVPLYELSQSGAIRDASPEAKAFTTARLAAGASEVRDMIEDAWKASATMTVGYPVISVADIEARKVILTRNSYGSD